MAALLAGCLGAPSPVPEPAEGKRAASVVPLELPACRVLEALADVDAALAREHVPEDFEPIVEDGRVRVIFGATTCEGDGATRSFVAIGVRPIDPALEDPDVARHFWEPEHVVEGADAFAAAIAAFDPTIERASISLTTDAPYPAVAIRAENWSHGIESVGGVAPASIPEGTFAGVFREWFAAGEGYGYLQAEYGAGPVGAFAGTLTTGEGTIARELFGAESGPHAGVAMDGVAFVEAKVGFVPR